MKKKLAIMLLTVMTVSLVACGKQDDTNSNDNVNTENTVEEGSGMESEVESEMESEVGNESDAEADNVATADGALGVFDAVWNSFVDEMTVVMGGDASGYFGYIPYELTTAEDLDGMLGYPAEHFEKVDNVAYMMHMMNANTFTSGVYQLKDADDVQTVADALKENIMNREWMCGFPDKLIVISFDDYVVATFGNTQAVDAFKTSLTAAYENATLLYEESIS